jgi:antitoxin (DNA-binding transcriptional repressor) of toxin-antitoxin stability system
MSSWKTPNGKEKRDLAASRQSKRATVYNWFMAKDVIRISEAEAASDFAGLMARVRAGAEIIIENGERVVAVLHAAEPVRRRISDCIALAKAHEEESGKAPVLDPDFAEDVEEILRHRKPWNPPAWE